MKNNTINNFTTSLDKIVKSINNNKYILALSLLLLNVGSKYIDLNLTKGQELLIKSISREILIFAISFMGSHDIIVSIVITILFSIITKFLFNENSNFCVLPSNFKELSSVIDTNNDNILSKEEVDKAISILQKAKNNN